MQKHLVPEIGTSKKYTLSFSAPLYSSGSNEKVISSTGFAYNGFTQYIHDLPQSANGTTTDLTVRHPLQIYRIIGDNKQVTIQDAGFIIAEEGLVVLENFNPSAYDGNYITISAQPNSNDIAPKRNQLLQIDMGITTINPEVDTIATGGSIAGIGYNTTPRHND
jgi:hypothetical protein